MNDGDGSHVAAGTAADPPAPGVPIMPSGKFAQLLPLVGGGGLSAVSLHRSRSLYRHLGVVAPILTLDFTPECDRIRSDLRARGEIVGPIDVINVYEHFRDADLDAGSAGSAPADGSWLERVVPAGAVQRQVDSAGRLVRILYADGAGRTRRINFYRRDGSRYLTEVTCYVGDTTTVLSRRFWLRDSASRIVAELASREELFLRFLEDHAAGERLFIAVDRGMPALRSVLRTLHPTIHFIPVVHNVHVEAPRHYYSPLKADRKYLFASLDRVEGIVILNPRQRLDVVARLGDRNNIFTVPNAVREWPEVPAHETREHLTCVVISRLTDIKRIDHAVRAFPLVLQRVPKARLEIHGRGESAGSLHRLIKRLGLTANVEMMGYSPDARRRFTQVAASLLTSVHEGQPMSILESLASGCPVIAYDIKYGPADMIDDGEQGFLVPEGDLEQLADTIVRVLTDRALAERLSVSARQRAETVYNDEVQARRWSQVYRAVGEQRPRRTVLRSMSLRLQEHGADGDGGCFLRGSLAVDGDVPAAAADDLRISCRLYAPQTREFAEVPVSFRRTGELRYDVDVEFDVEKLLARICRPGDVVDLSICLTWNNSYLETPIDAQVAPSRRLTQPFVAQAGAAQAVARAGAVLGCGHMSSWKKTVNTALTRATGYQLERAKPAGTAKAQNLVSRLDTVTRKLERLTAREPAKASPEREFPDDYDEDFREIMRAVKRYTSTGSDELHGLISATKYLHRHGIAGDVVECGVRRGGSMHAVARTLDALGDHSRELYLFDTFEGTPRSLQDARAGFEKVKYPAERLHCVVGKVVDTVPAQAPETIALLRLNTDGYESMRHEFEHLYPRLVSGGVLIVDDFGWWQGSREATEEFLERSGARLLLLRAGSGRIAVKP